ncbi:hypothetical protein [Streptomyces sp. NPDC014733]|uniref:hypothetical protein n=1 Tax=Streptomyces sp. NPDC014733 TaxID=3364885 RepID=UPI0036FD9974
MTYEPSGLATEAADKISRLAEDLTSGRGAFNEPKNAARVYKALQQIADHMPLILSRATSTLQETTRDPDHADKAVQSAGVAIIHATTVATRLKEAQEAAEKARRR